jgi:PBSX family phage portal protein
MSKGKANLGAVETAITTTGNETTRKALRQVKATIIGGKAKPVAVETRKAAADGTEPGKSTAMTSDPFAALQDKGQVIEPPFDMLALSMLNEYNTEIEPCVSAMEVNIEGFGHRFIPRVKKKAPDGKDAPPALMTKVQSERVTLENFFAYCTRESFVSFRRRVRRDLELTGNGYFEVIRGATGNIQSFVHIPSYQMRIGIADDDAVKAQRNILELQIDGSVKVKTIDEWRRFRKYVQSRSVRRANMEIINGHKMVWFKEFGDDRIMNNETGELATKDLSEEKRANECIHMRIYSSRSPYGLPRYIGNLLSVYGDRAAEEINFYTFKNNNVPSMVIAVSNGQLTGGTIDRIKEFTEAHIQDSDNYSRFLILEAETDLEGEDGSHIKMEIKPLAQEQHTDALFQNYSEKNRDKIRRAWRLPPILVGRADDYTRTTADSSRQLADEQIFAPERDEWDDFHNRILFPEMGIIYHKFKSNSPNTTDNTLLVRILAQAEKTGGVNPRIARMLLEDILGTELPDFPDDFNADIPFSLLMAEAVKNKAEPNEPGQQVTALKELGDELGGAAFVDYLVTLNKQIEKKWRDGAEFTDDEGCVEDDA